MSKKFGFRPAFQIFAVLGLIGFTASPALAVKEFKDAFKAKYIKPDSTAANEVALAEALGRASCAVCHVGENKKMRNDYGQQVGKLVGKRDKKDMAKIQAALDAVAKLKSNPADPASPTYGEKIAAGKLPASR
jgi:mono/diheme cytochrome c family protein